MIFHVKILNNYIRLYENFKHINTTQLKQKIYIQYIIFLRRVAYLLHIKFKYKWYLRNANFGVSIFFYY